MARVPKSRLTHTHAYHTLKVYLTLSHSLTIFLIPLVHSIERHGEGGGGGVSRNARAHVRHPPARARLLVTLWTGNTKRTGRLCTVDLLPKLPRLD